MNRGNVVAVFEDALHPASNLGNTNTALVWRSTSLDKQTVDIELGGSVPIGGVMSGWRPFGSMILVMI